MNRDLPVMGEIVFVVMSSGCGMRFVAEILASGSCPESPWSCCLRSGRGRKCGAFREDDDADNPSPEGGNEERVERQVGTIFDQGQRSGSLPVCKMTWGGSAGGRSYRGLWCIGI
ncbi:hypothetical protein AVEN_170924-1 [Araneus ventricosus]|uniref:Uncharacterized protein n=1 Tax=Araneus ventricosus TaxID=182803 RepID=A0A4Y2JEM3_ARAVE|nr:hypothetical protein AVEN_170924-1 [Araneus ventricosus]